MPDQAMNTRKRTLTEATIRAYVGTESFSRGERYFREGRIANGRRAGLTLTADCYGSSDNVYRVQATVQDGAILQSNCSCPVGPSCKHVAALLLTWLALPKDFRAVEETDRALERRSKEELIALVKQMLRRAPELESLLELPLPAGKKAKERIDPKALRRQVGSAFRGYGDYYGAETSVANDLSATLEIGEGYLEQWLMKRRQAKGDLAGALAWVRRIYELRPSLVEYQRVRELASQLGTWSSVQAELVAQLQEKGQFNLLTQIHLDEQDVDAALETVAKIRTGFGYYYPDLRLQVAKAAEETHPRESLHIYLQAAEQIVKARYLSAYGEAVKYLLRVRKLYDRLDEREVWEQYLRKLKEETKAMRAFKAELAKAKL